MGIGTAIHTKGITGEVITDRPWELDRADLQTLVGYANASEAFGYPRGLLLFQGYMWEPGIFRIQIRISEKGWPKQFELGDFSPITSLAGLSLGEPFECEDLIFIPELLGTPGNPPGA